MRAEYGPPPILLLDRGGDVRTKLGVEEETTQVLMYREGRLVARETRAASQARARELWAAAGPGH